MKIPLTPIRFLNRAESQFGKQLAVVDGDREWTYREYGDRCRQLSNLLRSFDLTAGSRVAYLAHNTHELLEAYYGVPLAECVFLPLNVRLTEEDLCFILDDAQVECLFFHREFLPVVEKLCTQLPDVRYWIPLDEGDALPWLTATSLSVLLDDQPTESDFDHMQVDEDSVVEIFYTSGTTSLPKGVMLTHRNLYLHALEAALSVTATDADVQLHTIPLFHVNGWGTPQFLTGVGGTHVMLEKFDPAEVLRLIEKHRVTLFAVVPTMATWLLNCPDLQKYDVSSVRRVTFGGSAANPTLIRKTEEAFQCEGLSGYGMTETSPVLTISVTKDHLELSSTERYELQAMAGYPIMGVEMRLVDGDGRSLPWDGVCEGEIAVRGDMVMEGYWNRPDETAEVMRGGWFHTGDVATINPDGYVQIVDRAKDIIISGGENISSIELEKVLLLHSDVLECAVIPVPDENWGEVPKGLVVLQPDSTVTPEALLIHCRQHLAGFKMPKSIDLMDELPKGGTGKILKRELRDQFWTSHTRRVH